MKGRRLMVFCAATCLAGGLVGHGAGSLHFAGYDWVIRSGEGGPGPNLWDERNVWVDEDGALHLKIGRRDGRWSCAEVTLQQRLGFGAYEFEVSAPLDRLDDRVVLGLFNYSTADVGPDATHEIDIEFSRWGDPANPAGNYVVWPAQAGLRQQAKTFAFTLEQPLTLHRFVWTRTEVSFGSWRGLAAVASEQFGAWTFRPADPDTAIAAQPMPVHLNLWLFRGQPPRDGQEVGLVIRAFRFTAPLQPPTGFRLLGNPGRSGRPAR